MKRIPAGEDDQARRGVGGRWRGGKKESKTRIGQEKG